jgi:hypothetical protein
LQRIDLKNELKHLYWPSGRDILADNLGRGVADEKIPFVFRRVARHKPGCNGESCTSRNTFDISKKMDLKRLDLRAKQ